MPNTDNNKRVKPDDLTTSPVAEISNNELARMITAQGKTMTEQINQLSGQLRAELKEGLDEIKQEIDAVRTNLLVVRGNVDKNSNEIARSKLSSDVIISGVPYYGKEDLHQYFYAWCSVLGYQENAKPVVDIRRITREPLRDGQRCYILVQFAIANQRNDFYGKYLRSQSLTLRHVGFNSDDRVYVNENLIPSARAIKSRALQLKKEGKLTSVFSRNGVIHVKPSTSDQDCPITALEQLKEFTDK